MTTSTRTTRETLTALSQDLGLLVKDTMALARAEAGALVTTALGSVVALAAGAALLVVGALVLVSCLVLIGVALGLPPWAASAIVGLVLMAGGALLVQIYLSQLRTLRVDLQETRRSVTETIAWLKSQTNA